MEYIEFKNITKNYAEYNNLVIEEVKCQNLYKYMKNLLEWNKNINLTNTKIGLPQEIYTLKPAKSSNFEYSYKIDKVFKEPENIIEEIKELINNLTNKFKQNNY